MHYGKIEVYFPGCFGPLVNVRQAHRGTLKGLQVQVENMWSLEKFVFIIFEFEDILRETKCVHRSRFFCPLLA
jgi:hypothetical protein